MPLVDPPERQKHHKKNGFDKLLTGHLPLEHETVLFLVVNFLDFILTYWLISSGRFRESNPIANYFLEGWGPFRGMLYFKVILVATVCTISQIVALKQEHTARWLLNFGTIAVGLVLSYSLALAFRYDGFSL